MHSTSIISIVRVLIRQRSMRWNRKWDPVRYGIGMGPCVLNSAHSAVEMSLLLEEEKYKAVPDGKKVLFLLQWLQNLPQVIKSTDKVKSCVWVF